MQSEIQEILSKAISGPHASAPGAPDIAPTSDKEHARAKYVFFDFDQTISRCHVFKQLAGWEGQRQCVPPPFATTERGQITRIAELNQSVSASVGWRYDEQTHLVTKSAGAAGVESWSQAALGGSARVEQLRKLFSNLREKGATLIIITKGFIGAVRKILSDEQLLECFEAVYGNIGPAMYGFTDYDQTLQVPSPLEGSEEYSMMNW